MPTSTIIRGGFTQDLDPEDEEPSTQPDRDLPSPSLSALSVTTSIDSDDDPVGPGHFRKVRPQALTQEEEEEEEEEEAEEDDEDERYIVDALLEEDHFDGKPYIQVKWEGYTETTWEPRERLIEDVPEKVRSFDRRMEWEAREAARESRNRGGSLSPLSPRTTTAQAEHVQADPELLQTSISSSVHTQATVPGVQSQSRSFMQLLSPQSDPNNSKNAASDNTAFTLPSQQRVSSQSVAQKSFQTNPDISNSKEIEGYPHKPTRKVLTSPFPSLQTNLECAAATVLFAPPSPSIADDETSQQNAVQLAGPVHDRWSKLLAYWFRIFIPKVNDYLKALGDQQHIRHIPAAGWKEIEWKLIRAGVKEHVRRCLRQDFETGFLQWNHPGPYDTAPIPANGQSTVLENPTCVIQRDDAASNLITQQREPELLDHTLSPMSGNILSQISQVLPRDRNSSKTIVDTTPPHSSIINPVPNDPGTSPSPQLESLFGSDTFSIAGNNIRSSPPASPPSSVKIMAKLKRDLAEANSPVLSKFNPNPVICGFRDYQSSSRSLFPSNAGMRRNHLGPGTARRGRAGSLLGRPRGAKNKFLESDPRDSYIDASTGERKHWNPIRLPSYSSKNG